MDDNKTLFVEYWHKGSDSQKYVLLSDYIKATEGINELRERLKAAESILGGPFDEILKGVSHCIWCSGYCLSHADEICDCDQKPLLSFIERAREYQAKYGITCNKY